MIFLPKILCIPKYFCNFAANFTIMTNQALQSEDIKRCEELFSNAQNIVILTHMGPDGDAMGSALAFYHWLNGPCQMSNVKSVQVIVPNAFPSFFNWMPGADKVLVYENNADTCDKWIDAADLIVCTDFNDPKRIGPIGEKMLAHNCPKILIDHHIDPVCFADVTFSYPDSPSACQIVYYLLKDLTANDQSPFTNEVAVSLYTGMMTDTGNFSFNSNHPEMYEIIADLVRMGVDKDAVYNAVFNQHSENRMRLWGYALYRKMRIYPEFHAALIVLDADELDRYHHQVGDTEGLVNMPLQISDVYYSVFIREERAKPGTPHSRIRLSFRSQGDRPVNIFANEIFRGGGHMNAAGGELFGTVGQAVRLFEKNMNHYLKKE